MYDSIMGLVRRVRDLAADIRLLLAPANRETRRLARLLRTTEAKRKRMEELDKELREHEERMFEIAEGIDEGEAIYIGTLDDAFTNYRG